MVSTASGGFFSTEISWLGGTLRNVAGLGDRSAYGLPDEHGVIIEHISPGSILEKSPLMKGDVIRKMNTREVRNCEELMSIYREINWTGRARVEIIRNQKAVSAEVSFK